MSAPATFDRVEASELRSVLRKKTVTDSGWLTSDALKAGMEQIFYADTLSHRPPKFIAQSRPLERVALYIEADYLYTVKVFVAGTQWRCRTRNLNWARKVFAAYVTAFTSGEPSDFSAALSALHETKE